MALLHHLIIIIISAPWVVSSPSVVIAAIAIPASSSGIPPAGSNLAHDRRSSTAAVVVVSVGEIRDCGPPSPFIELSDDMLLPPYLLLQARHLRAKYVQPTQKSNHNPYTAPPESALSRDGTGSDGTLTGGNS